MRTSLTLVATLLSACTGGDTSDSGGSTTGNTSCSPTLEPVYACELPEGYDPADFAGQKGETTAWMESTSEVAGSGTGVPPTLDCVSLDLVDGEPPPYDPADTRWLALDYQGLTHILTWTVPGAPTLVWPKGDNFASEFVHDFETNAFNLEVRGPLGTTNTLALWVAHAESLEALDMPTEVHVFVDSQIDCSLDCGDVSQNTHLIRVDGEQAVLAPGESAELSRYTVFYGGDLVGDGGCEAELSSGIWLAVMANDWTP